jgi:hypothetical protein
VNRRRCLSIHRAEGEESEAEGDGEMLFVTSRPEADIVHCFSRLISREVHEDDPLNIAVAEPARAVVVEEDEVRIMARGAPQRSQTGRQPLSVRCVF